MKLLEDKRYSVEEYFALVEASEQKLEFIVGGFMPGTSNHSTLAIFQLDDRDCLIHQ